MKDEIARYGELLRRDPGSRVFAPLAEAWRREGRLEEALALARTGVSNHPAWSGGRIALGRVLLDMGRVREAAEEFGRAIAAAPGSASPWRLLGDARARLRDRSGAFEAFARALALDPLDETARAAVLDIDSRIASSAPEAAEPALSAEFESEGSEDGEKLTGVERAWLEEGELSLLLIPEDEGGEGEAGESVDFAPVPGADPPFLAGRLEILDIVHSSLAPEAAGDPDRAVASPEPGPLGRVEPGSDSSRLGDAVPDAARPAFDPGKVPGAETHWELPEEDGSGVEAEREEGEPAPVPPDLRTETLADLYVQQGHLDRAREIYRAILDANPLQLRVKKKLFDLPPPAPPAGDSAEDRRLAELGRWLDRARSAAERPRSGSVARKPGIGDSRRMVTTPPTDEGP